MSTPLVPANIDNIRSVAFGSITNSYTIIGTAFTHPNIIIKVVNTTDTHMLLSTDGVNDKDVVSANGFFLYDLASNGVVLPVNTPIYIKYVSAPTLGTVYLVAIYKRGT